MPPSVGFAPVGFGNSDALATLPEREPEPPLLLLDPTRWAPNTGVTTSPTGLGGGLELEQQKLTLAATTGSSDGTQTQRSLEASPEGVTFEDASTDRRRNTTTQSLGFDGDELTVSSGQKDRTGAGASNSAGMNVHDGTLELGRTTTAADKSGTAQSLHLGTQTLGANYSTGPKDAKSGGGLVVGPDGAEGSFLLGGHGAKFASTDHSAEVNASLALGKDLQAGFNASYDNGSTASSKDDVLKVGGSLGTKSYGGKIGFGNGNGEVSGDLGIKAGPLKAELGSTSISRSDTGFVDSELLGSSYAAESSRGGGYRGSAKCILGASGSSTSTESVAIQQQLDERGTYDPASRAHVEGVRDKVVEGMPLDVADLGMNQGAEIVTTRQSKSGLEVDPLVFSSDWSESDESTTKRAIARTQAGISIKDTHQRKSGTEEGSSLGMGLVRSAESAKSGLETEVVEYLLDAGDPSAMSYAQDYAQLGLLPNWNVVAAEPLVTQMTEALDDIRSGSLWAERWQAFLAENAALIAEINDSVRASLREEGPTNTSGVQLKSFAQSNSNSQAESSTTALLFATSSSRSQGVETRRYQGPDGSHINESSWRQEMDGASRQVTTSGGIGASTALRIEDAGRTAHPQGTVDLSPQVVQAIGEHINVDELQSGKAWHYMAQRASSYWKAFGGSTEGQLQAPPPVDDQGLLGRVAPETRPTLASLFAKVAGPKDFVALPADLQLVFVESTAYMDAKVGLGTGVEETRPGNHFDALAAIAVMDDPDQRDKAMLLLGRHVTREDRDPKHELELLSEELGGGVAYLIDEARQGRQADAGLASGEPAAWANALDGLVQQGSAGNPASLHLVERMREQGGTAFLDEVFGVAASKPLGVAKLLAANSVDAPRDFVKRVMVGSAHQKELDAWWGVVEHNLRVQEGDRVAEKTFAQPQNQVSLDGDAGLGGLGMDRKLVQARFDEQEQARKNQETIQQFNTLRSSAPPNSSLERNRVASMLREPLARNQVGIVVQELQRFRDQYGVTELDLLLHERFAVNDFLGVLEADHAALSKVLGGTLTAREWGL